MHLMIAFVSPENDHKIDIPFNSLYILRVSAEGVWKKGLNRNVAISSSDTAVSLSGCFEAAFKTLF